MTLNFDQHLEESTGMPVKKATGGIKIVKKTEVAETAAVEEVAPLTDFTPEATDEVKAIEPIEPVEEVAEAKVTKKRKTPVKRGKKTEEVKAEEVAETVEVAEEEKAVTEDKQEELALEETAAVDAPTEEVLREQAIDEGRDFDTGLPLGVPQDAVAKITVGAARTVNLGNYESARFEVSIELPVGVLQLDNGYAFAKEWVETNLEAALRQGRAPVEQPTRIHGSADAEVKKVSQPAKTSNVTQATKQVTKPMTTTDEIPAASAPSTKPGDQQAGDVGSNAKFVPGTIHDPNVDYDEDL